MGVGRIYSVIDSNGVGVGSVFLNDEILKVTNNGFTNEFNNILEVFDYLKSNMLHINDKQGALYSKEMHLEAVKRMEKIGLGYWIYY